MRLSRLARRLLRGTTRRVLTRGGYNLSTDSWLAQITEALLLERTIGGRFSVGSKVSRDHWSSSLVTEAEVKMSGQERLLAWQLAFHD